MSSRKSRAQKAREYVASRKQHESPSSPPDFSTSTEIPNRADPSIPSFEGVTNPWEFLERARQIPKQARGSYGNDYLKLVSKRDPLEADALVKDGAEVFGFRAKVGYEMVSEFRKDSDLLPAKAAAVLALDEGWLAEMVYDPGREDHALGYLVHRFARPNDPPEFVVSVTYGKRIYSPSWNSLIGIVLLVPSGIEEYGSDQLLFEEIDQYIQKYVFMDDMKFRALVATYVFVSWVYDRFRAIPYLRAIGQFSSGKSRFIEVVGSICYRPLLGSGASSPASIYRAITAFGGPTLILDEADFARSVESAEIIKILNQGYQLKSAVWKTERPSENGGAFEFQAYPTYSPKILATRGAFDDPALESRCLTYSMPVLKRVPDEIPVNLDEEFDQDALRLRNKLLLWRFRNHQRVKMDSRARIPGVEESRINQIVAPIIACTSDESLRMLITEISQGLSENVQRERRDSIEGMVADMVYRRWEMGGRESRLLQQAVLDALHEEYKLKHQLSSRRFSGILRGALNLRVKRINGYNYIMTDPIVMKSLGASWGLEGGLVTPVPGATVPAGDNGNSLEMDRGRLLGDLALQKLNVSSTGAAGPVLG